MSNKMLLTTKLDQRLLMNQQLKQVITLLQVTTLELKQQVKTWIESNPLIEVDEEAVEEEREIAYQYHDKIRKSTSNPDHDFLENIAESETLRDYLLKQTLDCGLNERGQAIAEAIIDAIDENGTLSMSVMDIHETIKATVNTDAEEIESILKMIQGFDPPGVGARSTQECLLNQLERLDRRDDAWIAAKTVLSVDALATDELNLKKMTKKTGLTEAQLVSAFKLIKTLHLNPGKHYSGLKEQIIEPELSVKKSQGKWVVTLTNSFLNRLQVNQEYQSLIKKNSRDKSFKTIVNQLQEAKLLVSGLKRRNDTLLAVATYIVERQGEFFDNGNVGMKPMNLSEVAAALQCHESTISRITTGKYMETPRGLFELKHFFPSHIKTVEGRSKSSVAVKSMIEKIIRNESESHTVSDEEITRRLNQEGMTISRRTVTKYREAMNIPTSYERSHTKWIHSGTTTDDEPLTQDTL